MGCGPNGGLLVLAARCPDFVPAWQLPDLPPCAAIALGDWAGDGDQALDVFVSGVAGAPNHVLVNDGRGGFTVSPVAAGLGPTAPHFVDVNVDGALDVPVTDPLTRPFHCPGRFVNLFCGPTLRPAPKSLTAIDRFEFR